MIDSPFHRTQNGVFSIQEERIDRSSGECRMEDILSEKLTCTPKTGEACQFAGENEFPFFQIENKRYCVFHAPMEAVMVGNQNAPKSEFDREVFNNFIEDRIKKISEDTAYKPIYKKSAVSSFNSDVIRYLEDHLGTRIGRTNFRGVIFPGNFICRELNLTDADFKNCEFNGECDFSYSIFKFRAYFDYCIFKKTTTFAGCKFEGLASFGHCRFNLRSGFEDATFSGELDLSYAKMSMLHLCCPSQGPSQTVQRDLKLSTIDKLDLNNADVGGMLCLRNRNLTRLELKKTVFAIAPVFASSTVGDDVVFRNAQFLDKDPSKTLNYTILKKMALSCGDLAGAETFRALEFLCQIRDKENETRFSRFLLYGYKLTSRFGTDSSRPLLLLAANTSAFTLFYYVYAAFLQASDSLSPCWFSFRQIFQPFQFFDQDADPSLGIFIQPGLGIAMVASCQSLLTLILVGLFLQSIYRVFNR